MKPSKSLVNYIEMGLIFFIVYFSATPIKQELHHHFEKSFVIWNVGQGQWTTYIDNHFCDHFDLGGGSKSIFKKVISTCAKKMHRIHLSHWDLDHLSYLRYFSKKIQTCIWNLPEGKPSLSKIKLVKNFKLCSEINNQEPSYKVIFTYKNRLYTNKLNPNQLSEVVQLKDILIPGDSPIDQEKIWSANPNLKSVKGLILGHHGSQTSTSNHLLAHLPSLKWAVASALKSRYGHPHRKTLLRLQKNKTPILKTEDWGSIHFEI